MRPGHRLRLLVLALILAVLAVIVFTKTAGSRPLAGELPKPVDDGAALDWRELGTVAGPAGVLNAAGQETVWFGGTVWAADSARWEAIEDGTWTFDSGVGSNFNHSAPWVNPYKDPSLHATMEGWIGIDNTYSEIRYFRRLTTADFAGSPSVCVGSTAGLGGSASLWCGVLRTEADSLCYAERMGYGNSWFVCMEHAFSYNGSGTVALQYTYRVDVESGWDYVYIYADTTGSDADVDVTQYTGAASGTANLTLTPGATMRTTPGPYAIKFCVDSDGAYSDEDGLYASACGALALDDIHVTGGGTNHTATFETGNDGWTLSPARPGPGGDWSDIMHVSDLPPTSTVYDGCRTGCGLWDSVLVFNDLSVGGAGGHGIYQDNIAMSPWIDLRAAGLMGKPIKFIEFYTYQDLPLPNYIFPQTVAQWYPEICAATGKVVTSSITSDGGVIYFYPPPPCTYPGFPRRTNYASVIPADAEQVRIGLGVISYCRYYSNCAGVSNATPYFDNVRFGVAGLGGAPALSVRTLDVPQDAFPQDGTLDMRSPGRVDCNTVKGSATPEASTSLGDTLTVNGGFGGAEVRVVFAVSPGPGIDTPRLNAWLSSHAYETTWQGLTWYSARMDSAEAGGGPVATRWMTAYHETDPNFIGADTDRDPTDLDPLGQMSRLKNDIFPDDLFTPGSRLCVFYKTRYLTGSIWYTDPDTAAGNYYEMEVLPSSMAADSTFNCLLYVDHADGRGAQPVIEGALGRLLPARPGNFEQTAWDRWDVRASESQQASFGRPANTQYGATSLQALGYRTILWDAGDLSAFTLVEEDAAVLIPWLTLSGSGLGVRNLYLSGDGIGESVTYGAASEPAALQLINEYAGAQLVCDVVHASDCPAGTVLDTTGCMPLTEAPGSHFGLSWPVVAKGSGCWERASLDVLSPSPLARSGDARGNLLYNGPIKGVVECASVSNWNQSGAPYKTVIDGMTVSRLRDPGCTGVSGVDTRLNDVLTWFGVTGGEACMDVVSSVSVPGAEEPGAATRWGLSLAGGAIAQSGSARFLVSAPSGAEVTVQIFDVAGRRVRTVFAGRWTQGERDLAWNLRDDAGRRVPGGLYFARLAGADQAFTRRLVVLP